MPQNTPNIQYRKAELADVPAFSKIINDCAELGLMLSQTLATLYENIRKYHVAIDTANLNEDNTPPTPTVVGVSGLSIIWANLGEICSLAVHPDYRGHGIGKALVTHCLDEARDLSIKKIMTLTYEQKFFESLNFTVIDRQTLPLKVWSACIQCPKNHACDEIAMINVLEDVAEIPSPNPAAPPKDKYIVPITLTQIQTKK
ncbi:Amino-acid acetyltransferase [Poriferisphaera corsica]|uniref:Amino-acid acetyltransferase n=1 Tax=Poriferisphaera corsica TaxID=2528020 RepID=A0A517YRW3_9BACT|nr:N-acetyltransferase [Poriferisphaera corsica]QDU32960.1 Amino-acid acetyltransferase [Poriferisphaera corsica]